MDDSHVLSKLNNREILTFLAGDCQSPGIIIGETDDLGFNVVKDRVHVHDLHATLLHLLGFDHEKLTYRFQGRAFPDAARVSL